jgi:hypothetical protein
MYTVKKRCVKFETLCYFYQNLTLIKSPMSDKMPPAKAGTVKKKQLKKLVEWGVLEHDEIPGNYHNQQTAILVPTKNINGQRDRDLLKDEEHLTRGADGKGDENPDGDGMGVNHGLLCPPDTGCGCAID